MVLISVACYFALREIPYGFVQSQSAIQATEDDLEARDASIFSVQGIPGKGRGIIAVRNIKVGVKSYFKTNRSFDDGRLMINMTTYYNLSTCSLCNLHVARRSSPTRATALCATV